MTKMYLDLSDSDNEHGYFKVTHLENMCKLKTLFIFSLYPDIVIYQHKQSIPLINGDLQNSHLHKQLIGINHVWTLFFPFSLSVIFHLASAVSLNIWLLTSAHCFIHSHSEVRGTACVHTEPWDTLRADVPVQTEHVTQVFSVFELLSGKRSNRSCTFLGHCTQPHATQSATT